MPYRVVVAFSSLLSLWPWLFDGRNRRAQQGETLNSTATQLLITGLPVCLFSTRYLVLCLLFALIRSEDMYQRKEQELRGPHLVVTLIRSECCCAAVLRGTEYRAMIYACTTTGTRLVITADKVVALSKCENINNKHHTPTYQVGPTL